VLVRETGPARPEYEMSMSMRRTFVGVRCRACGQPFEAHVQTRPVRIVQRLQFIALCCENCGDQGLYPQEDLYVFLDLKENRSN
jgi:RNase P subunit RPR2